MPPLYIPPRKPQPQQPFTATYQPIPRTSHPVILRTSAEVLALFLPAQGQDQAPHAKPKRQQKQQQQPPDVDETLSCPLRKRRLVLRAIPVTETAGMGRRRLLLLARCAVNAMHAARQSTASVPPQVVFVFAHGAGTLYSTESYTLLLVLAISFKVDSFVKRVLLGSCERVNDVRIRHRTM